MRIVNICVNLLLLLQLFCDTISHPVPPNSDDSSVDYEIEDRSRRNRRRRPCTRKNEEDGRWFFGHDLTLFLGDVTICGSSFPSNGSPGLYEGVVPNVQRPQKPNKPHKPHKPLRPGSNRPIKPVHEVVDEDEIQDNYYKPGPVVGALSNQVEGTQQNLSNFNPTSIFSQISRHLNKIVNPFIDLFYK